MRDEQRQIDQIRRLQHLRRRPAFDPSVGALIRTFRQQQQRTHKRLGQLIELWEAHVPEELARRTMLMSMRGGTLHMAVDSAATAYEVDRLLRSGLEQQLRSQYRGTLLRVRTKVSPDLGRETGEASGVS